MSRILFVFAALIVATPASAIPVVYGLTNGTITVQATQQIDNSLVFSETLSLNSSSFFTWDSSGMPASGFGGTLDDFNIAIDPVQGPFATLQPYGPFDMITIETAAITPDFAFGYQTNFAFPSGSGGTSINVGQIGVDATYSASNSVTGATTPGPVAAAILGANTTTGTVTFNAGVIQVAFTGLVMGTVDGTPFNEAGNDLNITANISFFGDSNVVPTPEPSTALLLGLGLASLGMKRR